MANKCRHSISAAHVILSHLLHPLGFSSPDQRRDGLVTKFNIPWNAPFLNDDYIFGDTLPRQVYRFAAMLVVSFPDPNPHAGRRVW